MNKKKLIAVSGAFAMMLAGIGLPATAMAADNTGITINAAAGNTLDGHTFTAYLLGTYTNVTEKDGKVNSYQLDGTDDSNAWTKRAVDAFNAANTDDKTDLSSSGLDDVNAITKASGSALRKVATRLAADANKPAAAGTANGAGSTVTLNVPDGLYLITDSAKGSVPMVVSTKIGGKDFTTATLGTYTVKSKAVTISKKLVSGNQLLDSGSLSVGSEATWQFSLNLPSTGNDASDGTVVSVKIVDAPTGQTYKANSVSAKIGNTDVTDLITVVDGGKQIAANASIPGDTARDVPVGGFGLSLDALAAAHPNETVTITAKTTITSTTDGNHPQSATAYVSVFDGIGKTDLDSSDDVPVTTHSFSIDKTSMDDATVKVNGAEFKIKDSSDKWLSYDASTGAWSEAADQDHATAFKTGDANLDGTVSDDEKTGAGAGRITFTGLGEGTYTVKETKAAAGFASGDVAMPSLTVTVGKDKVTFKGANLPALTVDDGDGTATVKNMTSLTQLPATGGAWSAMATLAAALVVAGIAVQTGRMAAVKRRESLDRA